ncbi:MAG: 3,4-dihydroxy-2-butanone-4-phosphate synthase, partial [Sphingomonadales bacterium]|nr:3,4-dihydroxy-2-butanone-4-phosphate synthase [Sphingomonadales bacterium]
SPRAGQLSRAMKMIAAEGNGAVVIIRDPKPTALTDIIRRHSGEEVATPPHKPSELRDYGIGAQILFDLGVRDMILLSNTKRTVIGLEGYGINIVEQREIPDEAAG